jgi:hypothetical protein
MNEILQPISQRATFIRERLSQISKTVGEAVLENSLLLRELKNNAYYREYGFKVFDDFIADLQDRGEIDYGPRQARNFLSIAEMLESKLLTEGELDQLGISKVREIASLPGGPEAKRALLDMAHDMSVSQVQAAAKEQRDKVLGRDTDRLHPVTLMFSETQRTFYKECIGIARQLSGTSDEASEAGVLVDVLMADWRSGLPEHEAE